MPPRHNPSVRRVRPAKRRAQRPMPPPSHKLSPDDIANIRAHMKEQLGGREPRVFQLDLVQAQEERRDALCQAATGQGKTAVAAGPYALEKNADRVTLMVSPLIGLQNEMTETFRNEFKLSTIAVNSSTEGGCSSALMTEIVSGKYRIVLISPEMLLSPPFINGVLRHPRFASRIYSVIIDEAHCISHWGTDFRKQYGHIGMIRVFLPRDVPFVAMSASLTERVIRDIVYTLQLNRGSGFLFRNLGNDRSNVSLVVRAIHNSQQSFSDLDFIIPSTISSPSDIQKTWIYADNIDVGTDIIDHLRERLPPEYHDLVRPYNAVHDDKYREEAMKLFREGKIRILVCTDAAGMGCNIPDIDLVIQWKLPGKLSSFIQRAGRAARDPSRSGLAVLLVEPAAYSVSTTVKNEETAGTKGQKQKQANHGKAKGQGFWKKSSMKGYAASRGRQRGAHSCMDTIMQCDEPRFDPDDPSEGLYNFVQATTCRRSIIGDVFNNPRSNPTVPCCDLCDLKLLDRTRPGPRQVAHGRAVQYAAEKCDALIDVLDQWREDVMERDEPHSLLSPSSILPDAAVEKLAKLALPLSRENIERFLAPQWPFWAKYKEELTSLLLEVNVVTEPISDEALDTPESESDARRKRARSDSTSHITDGGEASDSAMPDEGQLGFAVLPARKKARLANKTSSFANQGVAFHVNPQPATHIHQPSPPTGGSQMAFTATAHDMFHASPTMPIPSTSSLTTRTSLSVGQVPARLSFAITPTLPTLEPFLQPANHNDIPPVQAQTHYLNAPRPTGSPLPLPVFEPSRYLNGDAPTQAQPHRLYTPYPSGFVLPPSSFEPAQYFDSSVPVQAQPYQPYVASHASGRPRLPPSFEPARHPDRGAPFQMQPHSLYAPHLSGFGPPLASFEPSRNLNRVAPPRLGRVPPLPSFEPVRNPGRGAPVQVQSNWLYAAPHSSGHASLQPSFSPAQKSESSMPVQVQSRLYAASHLSGPAPSSPSFETASHATAAGYIQSYQDPYNTQGVSFAGEAGTAASAHANSQFPSPYHSISSPYPYDPYAHGHYYPYFPPQSQYPRENTQKRS